MELHLLEQLDAFAREGTLSKAAEALHMTQPALSHSMKQIEGELGVSLFVREKGKIALNETGRLAADCAAALLRQHREMAERIIAYDRSLHEIRLGSCAPYPITALMPLLQEYFGGQSIVSELVPEDKLIQGLKNHSYSMIVLREDPKDPDLFCVRYTEERLLMTVPEDHRLAGEKEVRFADFAGESVLIQQNIGFWMDVTKEKMPGTNLLVQTGMSEYWALIQATKFPFFNSDRMAERGSPMPGRVNLPIADEEAHAVFRLACLMENRKKYEVFFNAVRAEVLAGRR
ncbi:MAG: LysR family transcriptional regulator [Clostridia bacterium]|nr:LysR family transcriptional regulator [Clostridia bacterium]